MKKVLRINHKEVCHNQCWGGYISCPAYTLAIQTGGIDHVAIDRDARNDCTTIDINKYVPDVRVLEDVKKSMRQTCATCKFAKTRY